MSSPIALQELFKAGFEDFAIPSYETAPFTTIQNRAQVTRSLKAIAGIERVHVKGLNRLQNEFGPNGEQVWEPDTKDARIRFVGGWSSNSTALGSWVGSSSVAGDFVELTFYGTGLNFLTGQSGSGYDIRASIDGGAEGANLWVTMSSVIGSRNYSPNVIIAVTSGLTLGWHTVRLRNNAAAQSLIIHGFEILNQRSNLAVYPGAGISNGSFNGLSSLATSAFNDGVVGTRGARVVKYIENGTLKSAVQEVDSTAKYLTNADHTNEEIVRRVNWREFGANRADDLSTVGAVANSRAFTLDDGTTTLSADTVENTSAYSGLRMGAAGSNIRITFVGTGLDIVSEQDSTSTALLADAFVIDGASIGLQNVYPVNTSGGQLLYKICSGLPYGTHTFKLTRSSAVGNFFRPVDFIIYQPKKPSIPEGALVVADYNVMANYVVNTTAGREEISTGVLKKANMREGVFVGTWTASSISVGNYLLGFATTATSSGAYVEYTFFGTGAELVFFTDPTSNSAVTISVDGLTATTTNFPSATFSVTSPATFNSTTGILSTAVTNGPGRRLRISGLSLGVHKFRMTTGSATAMDFSAIDIITPIHINNPTLKVGSQSLKSVTKYSPEKSVSNAGPDLSKAKAWAIIDGPNNRILGSQNISAFLATATGNYLIHFEKPFKTSSYAAIGSCMAGTSKPLNFDVQRANSIKVYTTTDAGFFEANTFSVAFFGELIDE